jgi:hypothetical protein
VVSAEELATAFAPTHTARRVGGGGSVRFRRWRLYGERGLSGSAAVWLTDEQLVLSYSDELLAQHTGTYAAGSRHFAAVRVEQPFVTEFGSPSPPLWEPEESEWLRVLRLPAPRPRLLLRPPHGAQADLFALAN